MTQLIKILILISSITFSSFGIVLAGQSSTSSLGSFQKMREEVSVLMLKNQELKKQYGAIQQQFLNLKNQYETDARDVARLNNYTENSLRTQDKQGLKLQAIEDEIARLQGDVLLKETTSQFFNGDVIDLDEKQRLWALKISDLQYQKELLEVELKQRDLSTNSKKNKQDRVITTLKQNLMETLQEEEDVRVQIKSLQSGESRKSVDLLKQENGRLKRQVKELRERVQLQIDELSLLKKKHLYKSKSGDDGFWSTEKKKNQLEEEVALLETEYKGLNETLEVSISNQTKRKQLVSQVLAIDQENQQLRDQINELTKKIKSLNRYRPL